MLETVGVLLLATSSCQLGVAFSQRSISGGDYAAAILAPALVGGLVLVIARFLGTTRRARARVFAGVMLLLVLGSCGVWTRTRPASGTVGDGWPSPFRNGGLVLGRVDSPQGDLDRMRARSC